MPMFLAPVNVMSGAAYVGALPKPCVGTYLEWWLRRVWVGLRGGWGVPFPSGEFSRFPNEREKDPSPAAKSECDARPSSEAELPLHPR